MLSFTLLVGMSHIAMTSDPIYDHPTPSVSAYLQGVGPRPTDHIVWQWTEGVSLFDALCNLHAGRCWCGQPPREHLGRWASGAWVCSRRHQSAWWKQFEFWHDLRHEVLTRDKWQCVACGKQLGNYAQADHIVPISAGGAMWDAANLQALCADCHAVKTASDAGRRVVARRLQRLGGVPLDAYM